MTGSECTVSSFADDTKLCGVTGTSVSCCHPERPQQAGEMSWEEPHEIQ